jgi:hypothetical protein
VGRIHLVQDRHMWRAVVKTVMKLVVYTMRVRGCFNRRNVLTCQGLWSMYLVPPPPPPILQCWILAVVIRCSFLDMPVHSVGHCFGEGCNGRWLILECYITWVNGNVTSEWLWITVFSIENVSRYQSSGRSHNIKIDKISFETVEVFGNNLNKSKLHRGRNSEHIEVREFFLSFGSETFVFQFAIQKFKG